MLLQGRPVVHMLSLLTLSRGFAGMSKEVVTGLNILKQGQDPPLRKDEDLPDWLWKLAAPDKTLNELRRIKQSDLSPEQLARYVKLESRDGIRIRNHSRSK